MIDDPLKLFVVEYSMRQNSVCRSTLANVIENNLNNVRRGHAYEYVPIGLFRSREDADIFITHFNHTLAEQAQFEFHSRDWRRVADVIETLLKPQAILLSNLEDQK